MGPRGLIVGLVLVSLITGYGCFGPPGLAACGSATGYGPAMLESIAQCPAAVEKLGAPVTFSMFGTGCGNYESGGDVGDGLAHGDLPVAGSLGRANLDYSMSKGGGQWLASVLVLTFSDGSKLDVKACTASLEEKKGAEGMSNVLNAQCEQGQAAMCHALGLMHQARGDFASANEALAKACKLGLASDCRR